MKRVCLLLMICLAGCGQSEPTILGVWTDSNNKVYIEFGKDEFVMGEKSMKFRFPSGTYRMVDADTVEITFSDMGNKIRRFAKDPKRQVVILHEALTSAAEQSELEKVVQYKVVLTTDKLTVQPKDKPPVTFIRGTD